jgi:DNA polymerase (family X)
MLRGEMKDPATVAARLREIAAYLDAEEDNYRARAYQKAANAIESAALFPRLVVEGRLQELPGIGDSLATVIQKLALDGTLPLLEELRARWPRVLMELTRLPGVGVKKARVLNDALGVASLDELAQACAEGRVREVPGFGVKAEAKILAAIAEERTPEQKRLVWTEAAELSRGLRGALLDSPLATEVVIAGDVRRGLEVADRLAIAVATEDPGAVVTHLAGQPTVLGVHRAAEGMAELEIAAGIPLDLHLSSPRVFGLTLARATGSRRHWQALETRAAARGIDLATLEVPAEAELYAALGLDFVPPEIRDGDDLSVVPLVTRADIRGAVHCHTTYSDGRGSILEMAKAAEAMGLEYITITDHTSAASYAGGLGVDRLKEQWDEIDDVQQSVKVRLLKGTEADILADGALDWPDAVLERFDVIIASIHQRHGLGEAEMTARVVRAMRTPVFKIWGHALGRLLLRRDPIAVRFDEILDAIVESPAAIEINGDPQRMDLEPDLARRARERGVKFVLSSDAHSVGALKNVDNAVLLARRARLTRADVLNALPVEDFLESVTPRGQALP